VSAIRGHLWSWPIAAVVCLAAVGVATAKPPNAIPYPPIVARFEATVQGCGTLSWWSDNPPPYPIPVCVGKTIHCVDHSWDKDTLTDATTYQVWDGADPGVNHWVWYGQNPPPGSGTTYDCPVTATGSFSILLFVDDRAVVANDLGPGTASLDFVGVKPDLVIQGLDEQQEEDPGAFICLNDDNDDYDANGNRQLDRNQHEYGDVPVEGEDDLEGVHLSLGIGVMPQVGTVTLTATTPEIDRVWFWETSDKAKWIEELHDWYPSFLGTAPSWDLASGPFPSAVYAEGYNVSAHPRDVELKLKYEFGGCDCKDTAKATVVDVEIDMEDLSDVDEDIDGGYIGANQDDDNENGQEDRYDVGPLNEDDMDLVKITLERAPVDLNEGTITLSCASEKIRVWKTRRKAPADRIQFTDGKHQWAPADLPAFLFVEGYQHSDAPRDVSLLLEWNDPDRFVCVDLLKVTVVEVDLKIVNVPDEVELTRGALIPVNDDDDNASGDTDYTDDPGTNGEDDLMEITLQVLPEVSVGIVKLDDDLSTSGEVNVWEHDNRTGAVNLSTASWNLAEVEYPRHLYAEGSLASFVARGVKLRMRYTYGKADPTDAVAFSVMQVLLTEWIGVDPGDGHTNLSWDNPTENGGDCRIFAEKNTPAGQLHDHVRARATLNIPVPEYMSCTVYFRPFDMDDPMGDYTVNPGLDTNDDATHWNGGDNLLGSPGVTPSGKTAVVVSAGVQVAEQEYTITARQPGNNWRVVAHAVEDAPDQVQIDTGAVKRGLDFQLSAGGGALAWVYRTPLLFVWRKLHVERDSMASPVLPADGPFDGPGTGNDDVHPGNPGDPSMALMLTEYPRTYIQPADDLGPNDLALDTRDEVAFVHNLADASAANTANAVRDVASLAGFWAVQILGAYEGESSEDQDPNIEAATAGYTPGPCLIYLETIRDIAANYPGAVAQGTLEARTVLHETLHRFGLTHPSGGIMDAITLVTGTDQQNQLDGQQMRDVRAHSGAP